MVALCGLACGVFYHYVTSGGLTARQKPSAFESLVAQTLVDFSIPKTVKALKNPLSDSTDPSIGRDLYQRNCEVCHGYDGNGKTAAGAGLYPPPLSLSRHALETRKRTDGELFYLIQNGIRNTAMPGWQLPEQQIWQLVAYVRNLPQTASVGGPIPEPQPAIAAAHYVGSASCQKCHSAIYESWKKTLMANVVRDLREHPEAIIPDLSKPDPLLHFSTNDIALVYGSKWKQRYFKRIGGDYFPLTAQWDITHKIWRPYFVKDDWWAPLYPPDNFKRPTSATCDGCHSVDYNIATRTVSEWNVGCEKCHGPGSEHVAQPTSANIINPARLDYVQANDTCIQCHSQGQPLANPIKGVYYDWAVGYHAGLKLSDYWKLEPHKLGETSFTHFPDGTAHKNRMQGNDFVQSLMYNRGVTCFSCHDPHGSDNDAMLRKPINEICSTCHSPHSQNGPHAATIEEHTHHAAGSAGSQCVACHMPKIQPELAGGPNVASHTFHFVTPTDTETMGIPNACNVCHTDKNTDWAKTQIASWNNHSIWRMLQ